VIARRAFACTAVSLAILAVFAPRAGAENDLGLVVDAVHRVGDAVSVSYRVERPFTPKLEDPLMRGMPATVTFEIGVWRHRALWFDKLMAAYRSEHKIVFDPWTKSFQIRSGTNAPRERSVPDLDSLRTVLFRTRDLPVALTSALDSTATHYVTVKVIIRPLSADDLGEVEDWLAGGDPDAGEARGLPSYLLEWAASLSGLGERSALERSPRFVPRLLSAGGAP
jgi:hypothetical protein